MSLEDFIIIAYCCVEQGLIQLKGHEKWRSRGFAPKLSDAEVITMELVGEFLGYDTDTAIWRYFKNHWTSWFPGLGSRANFSKQAANLWKVKQIIARTLSAQLGSKHDILHIADGFPMPTCHFKRAHGSRCFTDSAAYGFCASKGETYYGFKGNLVINSEGVITAITVTAANVDERESLWEIINDIDGLLLADKGLIGEDYRQQLLTHAGVNLQTPARNNMVDSRGKDAQSWLVATRRLVETVIGQLSDRLHIEKMRARDTWHLTSRIARKVLAHTVGIIANKIAGNPPLQFEKLGCA